MQQGERKTERAGAERGARNCRCKSDTAAVIGAGGFAIFSNGYAQCKCLPFAVDCKLLHRVVLHVWHTLHTLHSALNLSSRQLLNTPRLMSAAWLIGFVPYETNHTIIFIIIIIVTKGKVQRILRPIQLN